jgi:hypothetical protein
LLIKVAFLFICYTYHVAIWALLLCRVWWWGVCATAAATAAASAMMALAVAMLA